MTPAKKPRQALQYSLLLGCGLLVIAGANSWRLLAGTQSGPFSVVLALTALLGLVHIIGAVRARRRRQ